MSFDGQGWTPSQVQTEQVPVKKPRRNRKSARAAGQAFERLVANYLRDELESDFIDCRVKRGRNDRGDIAGVRTVRGARVVIEAKNVVKMALAQWLGEAELEAGNDDSPYGVVVHKRHGKGQPEDQYVTMTLATFAALLQGGPDDYRF